jgi:amidase
MPLGYVDYNGRPFGLSVAAPAGKEDLLVKVMSAWEATFPERKPPQLLES